jgi:hypothetical protein
MQKRTDICTDNHTLHDVVKSNSVVAQRVWWQVKGNNAIVLNTARSSYEKSVEQNFSLSDASPSFIDAQAIQHHHSSRYLRTDGSSRAMDDVWFAADTARTIDQSTIEIDDAIAALPNLLGFGSVHNLYAERTLAA